jgi:hypothetical protein
MVYPHIQYLGPAHPGRPQSPDAASRPQSPDTASARELDSRVNDGIHVRLLWHASDGHVSVAVRDTKTGEAFELAVGEGERALDVYRHPYAYAALAHVAEAGPARLPAPSAVSL